MPNGLTADNASYLTFKIRLHPQGNKESNKDFCFFQVFFFNFMHYSIFIFMFSRALAPSSRLNSLCSTQGVRKCLQLSIRELSRLKFCQLSILGHALHIIRSFYSLLNGIFMTIQLPISEYIDG